MAAILVKGRMRPRLRKGVLVAHIVAAGAWIGLDVMLGVLVFTPLLTADTALAALCYRVMPLLYWPVLVSGLLSLATGVALGVGTHHGLVRHWWVLVKLVLSVVLCTLIVFALRPGMEDVTAAGQVIAAGGVPGTDLTFLFFPPTVSLTTLSLAVVLSVFKPWGRVRR